MKKLSAVILVLITVFFVFAADPIKDTSKINSLDKKFMQPYSKSLDTVGDVFVAASIASAGVLAFEDSSEYLTIGTMYAETMALSFASNEVIKVLTKRDRPFTYYAGGPSDDDNDKSFPSRHSTLAFAGASFTSYVFCKYNPESQYKIPVIAGCSALALATSAVRVASGNHFVTDVVAGAALGTVIGLGIPMLHTIGQETKAEVSVSPFGLAVKFNF